MSEEKNIQRGEVDPTYQTYDQNAAAGLAVLEQFLGDETHRPMEVQKALLMRLLHDNKDTEYGK